MKPGLRQSLIWISIGLNVAFAASLAAVALFPNALALHPAEEKKPETKRNGPDWYLLGTIKRLDEHLNLTQDQKATLDGLAETIKTGRRDALNEMQSQRARMMQTIILHPSDEAKVQAVMIENRAMWDMFSDELVEGLRDVVSVLTPEQRAILAGEISKPAEASADSKSPDGNTSSEK